MAVEQHSSSNDSTYRRRHQFQGLLLLQRQCIFTSQKGRRPERLRERRQPWCPTPSEHRPPAAPVTAGGRRQPTAPVRHAALHREQTLGSITCSSPHPGQFFTHTAMPLCTNRETENKGRHGNTSAIWPLSIQGKAR